MVVGGACWFLGAGEDGSDFDGTDENCIAVLTALDAPGSHGFQRTLGIPLGCAVSPDPNFSGHPDWILVTGSSSTTAAARGKEGRACACRPAR